MTFLQTYTSQKLLIVPKCTGIQVPIEDLVMIKTSNDRSILKKLFIYLADIPATFLI